MRTLTILPARLLAPVFNTAQDAIAYRSPRLQQAEQVTSELSGQLVADVSFSDTHLLLKFDSHTLKLSADAGVVAWKLESADTSKLQLEKDPEPLLLQFRTEAFVWRRSDIMQSNLHCRFQSMYASDDLVWLYFHGHTALGLSVLDTAESGPLLFWQND